MIVLPFLGAASFGISTLLEKIVLKDRKVNLESFVVAVFLSSVLIMIPLVFFLGKIGEGAFSFLNIFLFVLVIGFSIIANLLGFYAIRWEKLTHLEPVRLLEPLFVVILAFIFFKSERDLRVIIPAFIAGLTLVLSHVKKHHLDLNKYILAGIASGFFYALELLISNHLLLFYSPIALYFIRGLGVLVFLSLLFKPSLKSAFTKNEKIMVFLTGGLWVAYRVITYYGYLKWGMIFTTLILMLAPLFVYLLAWKFLKEKLEFRNILATIIILCCVIYVVI